MTLPTVSAETWSWTTANGTTQTVAVGAGGVLVAAPLLMILFRQKYPPQCGIARNRFTSGSQLFRSRRASGQHRARLPGHRGGWSAS